MNTQSNAISQAFESSAAAQTLDRPTNPFYWSVRRELWENRYIYVGLLATAAVFFLGFLIRVSHLPRQMRTLATLDPMKQHDIIASPYDFIGGLMMAAGMIIAAYYCLDSLHGERRDRSILFWKSLPVSDLTTVLSKASIPLVILPLLEFAIAFATSWLMLMISSTILLATGQSVAAYWTQLAFFQMALGLFYHLIMIHALWHAPIYAYFMWVSAWARRVPFLWAVMPILAIIALEKLVFGTTHFASFLMYRLGGGGEDAVIPPDAMPMNPMTHLTPIRYLLTPGLWLGLIATAAFLFAAARLRRSRSPI